MAMVAESLIGGSRTRQRRRHPTSSGSLLIASLLLLQLFSSASALSVAPSAGVRRSSGRGARVVSTTPARSSRSGLFPTRPLREGVRGPYALYSRSLVAASPSGGSRMKYALLSKMVSRHAAQLRRSILRAAAVFSLILCGFVGRAPPALAAKSNPNVVVVSTSATKPAASSLGRTLAKVVVTGGSVAAGAFAAQKVRTMSASDDAGDGTKTNTEEDDDGILNVVPKDKPSPLPLSSEWVDQQLKEVENTEKQQSQQPTKSPNQPKPTTPAAGSTKDAIGVKDLDSKIEMLRLREAAAKADAERKRTEDIARIDETRKNEQAAMDARIASEAAKHKKREAEREEQLKELEWGKREQVRLEGLKRSMEEEKRKEEMKRVEEAKAEEENAKKREEEANAKKRVEEEEVKKKMEASKSKNAAMPAKTKPPLATEDVARAREQPKPLAEEERLKERYSDMDLEERAFNILVDLGMVDLHSDPGDVTLGLEEED